ncbi:hypothetical protein Afil01_66210 [Actinorhabdospora filicis]|uniref:Lipoprotein n=1 Tax=Actinorhabdospora filicis TaxID=1785913 RepID=A0A9W6WCN5_9ACTN|nr:hypothetical protein Afil01_66210 [Actinorhabdospora filicis]
MLMACACAALIASSCQPVIFAVAGCAHPVSSTVAAAIVTAVLDRAVMTASVSVARTAPTIPRPGLGREGDEGP